MNEQVKLRPTWPENRKPTAREFRDWYVRCPSEQQIETAEKLLWSQDEASRCFMQGHDSLLAEVQHLRVRSHRYRLAWKSASRYRVALWALRDRLAPVSAHEGDEQR